VLGSFFSLLRDSFLYCALLSRELYTPLKLSIPDILIHVMSSVANDPPPSLMSDLPLVPPLSPLVCKSYILNLSGTISSSKSLSVGRSLWVILGPFFPLFLDSSFLSMFSYNPPCLKVLYPHGYEFLPLISLIPDTENKSN